MADNVDLVDVSRIAPNAENPRLIFRQGELRELEQSIAAQGILVPLTVFKNGRGFTILDGERRWRCARALQMPRVPVIVQPKPTRLQNIMMMFAIHNTRRDWDPLPTAMKLAELSDEYERTHGRIPREADLAQLASISVGEVRRLRRILALPDQFKEELIHELSLPRADQRLTVDHVLEATRGATALEKRGVIDPDENVELVQAIVDKFRDRTLTSTVEPRQLARIARSVERGEVSDSSVRRAVSRVVSDAGYTVNDAYRDTAEFAEFEHGVELLADRLSSRLQEWQRRASDDADEALKISLLRLQETIREILDD